MTTHHDTMRPLHESIHTIDPTVAEKVEYWKNHLPRAEYRQRIRELIDSYEDARGWEGVDGDDAANIKWMALNSLDQELLDERR